MQKTANVEVTSQQLLNELSEIKDRRCSGKRCRNRQLHRLGRVFGVLNTNQRRQIMTECQELRTREQLMTKFGFRSAQALNFHLNPLREGLIHETHSDGTVLFEWSLLFKRLQKTKREELLAEKSEKKNGKPAKRKSIPQAVRVAVLTEAGYRCAVPTCRGILALDLHHMVQVVGRWWNNVLENLPGTLPH